MRIFNFKSRMKKREEWLQNVSREQVLQNLIDLYCNGNHDLAPIFTSEQLEYFRRVFQERLSKSKDLEGWNEGTLTDYLGHKINPVFFNLDSGVALFYKILAHHAAYPFLPEASATLEFDAILRAAALLPAREHKPLGGGMNVGGEVVIRRRSETAARRLLFRSLAVPIQAPVDESKTDEQRPTTEISGHLETDSESEEEMLDVLAAVQPLSSAKEAPLSRQRLQPTASRLLEPYKNISAMCIPCRDMRALLKFLVACRYKAQSPSARDQEHLLPIFEEAAWRMLRSFILENETSVSWEVFDSVIEHIMPYLFTSLIELTRSFFNAEAGTVYPWPTSSHHVEAYYTLLPQLLSFLPKAVHRSLSQVRTISSIAPTSSSPSDLAKQVDSLRNRPGPLLLLILAEPRTRGEPSPSKVSVQTEPGTDGGPTANTEPDTTMVFGSFIPAAPSSSPHGTKIRSAEVARTYERSEFFQLAPVQDAFPVRSQGEGLAERSFLDAVIGENGELLFGKRVRGAREDEEESGGVSLRVDQKLEYGTFVHGVNGNGVYGPSTALCGRRGNERVEFKVRGIELVAL